MVITEDLTVRGYDLLERIGEGAYGAVYRAYQPHMRREVAIKIIQPRFANQPNFVRRFDLEAHLVAQLEHLHIVPLYDYWREPDGAYLVMRLLKGGSLESSLARDGPWDAERAVRLVEQIASALDAAHRQGVVHRDLKPANILLDEQGNAYLSDFGIAKELQRGGTITQTGAIIGTPAYISPEQVQSQPVTPQTDIYSLGVMVYELLVGGHPFLDTPSAELVIKHLNEPLPMVHDLRPELPRDVDQVIQRATAKDPHSRYADALELARNFRKALQLDIEAAEVPESEIYNPYKGLRPFQEADANDFYGRAVLTRQLLLRLGEKGDNNRFLAVVGPSGCGKSSVVKAGLVTSLREGALPGSQDWFITHMKPGAYPLEELELAILRVSITQPPSLLTQLKEDVRGLLRAVRRVMPEGSELVLVIDQLEELFTLVDEPDQVNFFLESLYQAVIDPHSPLRVIVTLRADYYDRPLKHPNFSSLIEKRTQVVKPLSTSELEQAIYEPANRLGVTFESGLVSTIVGEVHEEPGALPILQYALTELFERRDGRLITREAYEMIGGVRGALARRAEQIYLGLDEKGKEYTRQLLLRLVTLGEGQEDTRRRVVLSEVNALLGETLPGVIDFYGQARLLTFDHDPLTREPTVEVAHEALLQEWGRLREWLDESRADIRLQRVLGNAAEEWKNSGKDPGFLLRGSRLEQFEGWVGNTDLALTQLERDYIDASLVERRERELIEAERQAHEARLERRSRNFLRALVAVLAVAVIVAMILTGLAFNQRSIAQQSAATATFAQGMAISEAATAVAAQEEAQQLAASEALARQAAEKARQNATANELVAFAEKELENPTDVSYSLAILLARRAVFTTLENGDPVTPGAEDVLRQAIASAPIQNISLEGHTGQVNSASWSPDGKYIVTGGEDHTLRIWDVASGDQIRLLAGHDRAVNYVLWSDDGQRILSTSDDYSIRVWNAGTGDQEMILHGHDEIVKTADWSPDGSHILSSSQGNLNFWDAKTGEQLSTKGFQEISMTYVRQGIEFGYFSPNGDQVLTNYGTDLILLDAFTSDEINHFGLPINPTYASWNKEGSQLLTIYGRDVVFILDSTTGEIEQSFEHDSWVEAAEWNPDGALIASVTTDGGLFVWDSITGELRHHWQANTSSLLSVNWSPDGQYLLTTGSDGIARIWELETPGRGKLLEHLGPVKTANWSSDGSYILSAATLIAHIWDAITYQKVQQFDGHFSLITAAAWQPNGERVVTGDISGITNVWNAATGELIFPLPSEGQAILSAAWSPDGRWIVIGGRDGTARIWDLENEKQKDLLKGHATNVFSASWSPDQKMILTASGDGTAVIWGAESGEQLYRLEGHTGGVTDADWSSDGSQVVTAGNDGTVRIWDVNSGVETNKLIGHTGAVLSVEWSPGGGEIVTGGEDKTARIWDVSTGEEIGRISGHTGSIVEVHWSPDGSQILTASSDKTVRVWPVGIQGLLNLADSLILRDPPEFTPEERCLYLHECGE